MATIAPVKHAFVKMEDDTWETINVLGRGGRCKLKYENGIVALAKPSELFCNSDSVLNSSMTADADLRYAKDENLFEGNVLELDISWNSDTDVIVTGGDFCFKMELSSKWSAIPLKEVMDNALKIGNQ